MIPQEIFFSHITFAFLNFNVWRVIIIKCLLTYENNKFVIIKVYHVPLLKCKSVLVKTNVEIIMNK